MNIQEIHHDPYQWPEPDVFNPERFNTAAENNKWAKTADGKQRHAYAFTGFFGGKRICLGKTFAEQTTRFTLPLIYYHLDLAFSDPEA